MSAPDSGRGQCPRLLRAHFGAARTKNAGVSVCPLAVLTSTCPISPAQGFGLNPYGMAVALGTLLLTPLGHPVNVLVMGSGGYRFSDKSACC